MDRRKRLLTAKDCAAATGVTIRALRHYEKIGLIAPMRSPNPASDLPRKDKHTGRSKRSRASGSVSIDRSSAGVFPDRLAQFAFVVEFGDLVADEIAHRNDADHRAPVDDGQVAQPVVLHLGQGLANGVAV